MDRKSRRFRKAWTESAIELRGAPLSTGMKKGARVNVCFWFRLRTMMTGIACNTTIAFLGQANSWENSDAQNRRL
jgi:hypothetical protein